MRRSSHEPVQGDWLEGCIGFVVESDAGRIGRVADVQRDAGSSRPVALVLRAGMAGRRRLLVAVDEVAGVLPSTERIVLNGSSVTVPEEQAAPAPAR